MDPLESMVWRNVKRIASFNFVSPSKAKCKAGDLKFVLACSRSPEEADAELVQGYTFSSLSSIGFF